MMKTRLFLALMLGMSIGSAVAAESTPDFTSVIKPRSIEMLQGYIVQSGAVLYQFDTVLTGNQTSHFEKAVSNSMERSSTKGRNPIVEINVGLRPTSIVFTTCCSYVVDVDVNIQQKDLSLPEKMAFYRVSQRVALDGVKPSTIVIDPEKNLIMELSMHTK